MQQECMLVYLCAREREGGNVHMSVLVLHSSK